MSNFFERVDKVKSEYQSILPTLEKLGKKIDGILGEYLSDLPDALRKRIIQHPVFRVKEESSLLHNIFHRRNIKRSDDLASLYDMNDKVGTRIVLLTEADVVTVADFLAEKNEFWKVRRGRDLEKKSKAGFDYKAIHLYLTPAENLLEEFTNKSKEFLRGFQCEIQIRTNLQHSLAEVQHAVTYKNPYSLGGELESNLQQAYKMIEEVDDFISQVVISMENSDRHIQQLFVSVTHLYIQLSDILRPNANEDLFRKLIQESAHDLNAMIFQRYQAKNITIEEINNVCRENWSEISNLVNSKVYLAQEPIIVFIAFLFYKKRNTLRQEWFLSDEILEEIFHMMGTAFN